MTESSTDTSPMTKTSDMISTTMSTTEMVMPNMVYVRYLSKGKPMFNTFLLAYDGQYSTCNLYKFINRKRNDDFNYDNNGTSNYQNYNMTL